MSNQVDAAHQDIERVQPQRKRGGKWVTIGDEQYRIPPLNLAAVADLSEDVEALRKMGAVPSPDQMAIVVRIVHSAIVRNYPDMTEKDVSDMLDFGNYEAVLSAVLNISGFTKADAAAAGEATPSIGNGSMPS